MEVSNKIIINKSKLNIACYVILNIIIIIWFKSDNVISIFIVGLYLRDHSHNIYTYFSLDRG